MIFSTHVFEMPDSTFVILRNLIHERTGIYYDQCKQDLLADKLSPRLLEQGLHSFLDYYYLLKYDTSARQEWQELVNTITVPETFFWREFDQIEVLLQRLIDRYLEQQKKTGLSYSYGYPLKIWSAACSTGEEPLTIAMALEEAGWFNRLPIEIYATDISSRAIAKAKKGLYREHSFRALSPTLKQKYFVSEEQQWRIDPDLHSRIRWKTANLLNPDELVLFSNIPFIFCRNVFIYFSPESIQKTVMMFFEKMPENGYLFLGSSESILKLNTPFKICEINKSFIYVKNQKQENG
ncbi:protein-glutamate O-methyltransferase CheR [Roseofilum sp. BLCC_M154]|uniref:protein-glutamate O-methyltransferase n=1 Tax=Roseofilum acuticapitatum BLCC-M154 TaxID=3022444 RepID=A0ABT7AMI6_9CYAN|nr:protein-glutamate O-methyltransferase CheR [Roseofilum acuticapitatum]MDJ1168105.1 protein-glutamate O-methyltransferase CheR [Roseofilum acuticapitatum BLCC-M154]